jgi:hypothetical protein
MVNVLAKLIALLKSRNTVNREAREDIQRVLALPFDQVKQHALSLIGDTRKFKVTPVEALSNNPAMDKLGPVLQDFFSHFESVQEINGDFFVSRQTVSDSALRPGFIKIGSDFANSELVVKPGADRVFIVTDAQHRLDGLPSVYHNICLLE